jgi:cell division septation protein DedD
MARDDDNHSNNDNRFARNFDKSNSGTNQRQEPTLSRFDADDDFEEPDRDADYASGYHADDADEVDDSLDDYADDRDSSLFPGKYTGTSNTAGDSGEEGPDEEDPDAWDEDDEYSEDNEPRANGWPLSLIAVAVVALVLLAAGGYGVMQQRAAMEDELRQLRAELATTSSPSGDSAARAALEELQQAYDKMATEAEALRLENRTLTDTAAGLEAQLGKQQSTPSATTSVAAQPKPGNATIASAPVAKPVAAPVAAVAPVSKAPAPAAAKPVEHKPAATAAATTGPWFVNFGSYATREMADSWAARLKPGAGKVIVMPITSGGRTLYRLRVIGMPDRDSARRVARKLETELQVAELWVGKE